MSTQNIEVPTFEIGILPHLEPTEEPPDFSSSGDEYIAKMETMEPEIENNVRFEALTEEDRNQLLEGADSKSTKNSTKVGVKIFRGS